MNWKHLYAMMQLRLQLSKNQQLKVGKINYFLSKIAVGAIVAQAVVAFLITCLGVAFLCQEFEPSTISLFWQYALLGMVGYWGMMVIGQIQLSESISIERLLHLPVGLSGAFMLNFISSFSNSAVWLGTPILFGMAVGATIAKGPMMLPLVVATFAWVFLLNSLTYLFRGWISNLAKTKREKAMVGMAVPFAIIGAVLVFAADYKDASPITIFKNYIGDVMSELMGTIPSAALISGILSIGLAALFLSYRSMIRKYVSPKPKKVKVKIAGKTRSNRDRLMFGSIPLVSEGASAVAMATIKSILRAPEIMAAMVPLVVLIVLGSPYLMRWEGFEISTYVLPWIPLVIIAVTMIGFPAFIFSTFSYDRDGFRAFILSPITRRDILVGKNLGIGILTMLSGILMIGIFQIFMPTTILVFISHHVLLFATYLLMCPIGNFLSVYCPVGLKRGTMQPTNAPVLYTILLYLGVLAAPLICLNPATISCSLAMLHQFSLSEINGPAYLMYSTLTLIGSSVIYWLALGQLDGGLWNQQVKIVNAVANLPE